VTAASPRVLLTNSITLNGGDAAIVEATISTLREAVGPEVEFAIVDGQHAAAAALFPQYAFHPWPWNVFFGEGSGARSSGFRRRLTRARAYTGAFLIGRGVRPVAKLVLKREERDLLEVYARSDVVVAKGGTYLVEIYDLAPHLFDFRLCRLLRRPLILAAQSLGPFRDVRNARTLRRILRHALVFVRDEQSREHLEAIGVSGDNVRVSADSAFALADPHAVAASRHGSPRKPMTVAISVREWRHFRGEDPVVGMHRYLSAVAATVTQLVRRHGARVVFLSTCQGVPAYWTDDSSIARRIVDGLPADVTAAVTVDDGYHDPRELREKLAGFDLAISTRMHFAILALGAGVPVLPVAYEFKTVELFRRLGMRAHTLDIDTVEPHVAAAAVDRFVAALPAQRDRLFELVEGQRWLAECAGDEIADIVLDQVRRRADA
jgi:colanic acid/amylovoran biosynthesis protein